MKLTTLMIDLEGDTASLGLFGEIEEDTLRPPHVQITVGLKATGDSAEVRKRAISEAIEALEQARGALNSKL